MAGWTANWGRAARQAAAGPGAEVLTVSQLIVAFLRHADRRYRHPDGTRTDEYEHDLRTIRPLRRLYASALAAEFGLKALKAVRADMLAAGRLTS